MGLLEDLLRGGMGTGRAQRPHPTSLGGNSGNMSRILMTLLPIVLSMLAQRRQGTRAPGGLGPGTGAGHQGGGGLADILGGMLGGGGPLGGGGATADAPGGGGLGDILGGMLGGGGTANAPGGGGILGGLLERFGRAGFGQQAQSWVGTGPNEPLPVGAVEQVLGPGAVSEIARRAGLNEEETAQGLAHLLPEIVDHVTPTGTLPDENSLTRSVEDLIRRSSAGSES